MNTIELFRNITLECSDKLFEIFKNKIDESLEEANKNNLDPIAKYDLVYETIEKTYVELSISLGETNEKIFPRRTKHLLPELIESRICDYIEPIMKEVQEIIKNKYIEIQLATTIREKAEKYQELQAIMKIEPIKENIEYFLDIELDKKTTKIKKIN